MPPLHQPLLTDGLKPEPGYRLRFECYCTHLLRLTSGDYDRYCQELTKACQICHSEETLNNWLFQHGDRHNVGDDAAFPGFFDTPHIHDGSADCGDQDELHGCIVVNGCVRPDPNWVP